MEKDPKKMEGEPNASKKYVERGARRVRTKTIKPERLGREWAEQVPWIPSGKSFGVVGK